MKKLLLPLLIMLLSINVNAQTSKITIYNHTTCPAEVILYADFGFLGWNNCELESQQFLVMPGSVS